MRPMRWAPEETVTTRPVTLLEQQVGEREVAEVVGAELQLEAVGGTLERRDHDAGVVDEQVELAVPRAGELAHGGEAREVELANLDVAGHLRGGGLAPCRVSRTASTTAAPAPALALAAARPMPLLAPVTMAVRPVMSGRKAVLEVVMGNNVDHDNNDVNDYFVR